MWINQPGPVSDHVRMIGNMAFPCYWIEGARPALIDAGITSIAPLLSKHFGSGKLQPTFVMLTHSHYDHVGSLGMLRRLVPGIEVVASAQAREALGKPTVHKFILEMNRRDEKTYGLAQVMGEATVPLEPDDLKVDRVLADSDRLDLGNGVSVSAFFTPGHTRDSLSYLVLPDRLLLGGEVLGDYNPPDEVQPRCTSSYRDTIHSLERLEQLDFTAIALPHHGTVTEAEARSYIPLAIRCAKTFQEEVLSLTGQGQPPDQIAETLMPKMRRGLAALQPERAFRINLEAMIRVVLREFSSP